MEFETWVGRGRAAVRFAAVSVGFREVFAVGMVVDWGADGRGA